VCSGGEGEKDGEVGMVVRRGFAVAWIHSVEPWPRPYMVTPQSSARYPRVTTIKPAHITEKGDTMARATTAKKYSNALLTRRG
jgi:hypothetical protein